MTSAWVVQSNRVDRWLPMAVEDKGGIIGRLTYWGLCSGSLNSSRNNFNFVSVEFFKVGCEYYVSDHEIHGTYRGYKR